MSPGHQFLLFFLIRVIVCIRGILHISLLCFSIFVKKKKSCNNLEGASWTSVFRLWLILPTEAEGLKWSCVTSFFSPPSIGLGVSNFSWSAQWTSPFGVQEEQIEPLEDSAGMYLSRHQLGVSEHSAWDGSRASVDYLPLFNPSLSQPESHIKRERNMTRRKTYFLTLSRWNICRLWEKLFKGN